jgi:pyruvate,water dikinase
VSSADRWEAPLPGLFASSFRLGEWITGPVTPSFDDWALTRLEAAMHAQHGEWNGQPAPLPHHVVINGWYFYSLAWLPVTPRALLRWAPSLLHRGIRSPRRLAPVIPPTARYGIALYEQEWREHIRPEYEALVARASEAVEAAEVGALPEQIDELLDAAGSCFASITLLAGAAYKAEMQLAGFYHRHLAPAIGGSHLALLVGLGAPQAAPPHAVDTLDWSAPTLGERGPEPAAMDPGLAGRLRRRRLSAEAEARSALGDRSRRRRQFEGLLAAAQHLGPVREAQVREFTRPWPVLRRALLRIGTELVHAGHLERAEDAFYLRRQEVRAALEADTAPDLGATVHERRTAYEAARRLHPPSFVGRLPRAFRWMLDRSAIEMGADPTRGGHVSGIPVSPGVADGPARIVTGPADFDRLRDGDILVARATAPAWTPLFGRAAGVVTDGGSQFSHASVVAREYGIPAIAGCVDATRRLRDGELVRIDGSTGSVTSP